MCTSNCPGTWHDSQIAEYGIYKKIQDIYDLYNAKIVVDSAFQVMKTKPFLIKSSQQDPSHTKASLLTEQQHSAVRQLSEWLMRQMQGQFNRLKDPLLYEEFGERKSF